MNASAKQHLGRFGAAATLALSLCLPLAACGAGATGTATREHVVTVNTSSSVKVVPDIARISVAITTQGTGASKAQKANATPTNAVIARLRELGVEDKDIQTTYTDLSPVWNDDGPSETYEMCTVLEVSGLPMEEVSAVMDACVEAGATEVNGPEYYASGYDEAYEQALTQAIEAARPKAEAIAKASGGSLGKVVEVVEGYQDSSISYASDAGMAKAEAEEDLAEIAPGELSVEANATVSFILH